MKRVLTLLLAALLALTACTPKDRTPAIRLVTPQPASQSATALDSPPAVNSPSPDFSNDPFSLVSADSLLAYTEHLSTIQPNSGWRNSASSGEAEALDYLTQVVGEAEYLKKLGVELERQSFNVFLSTEFWQEDLTVTVAGQPVEVPAEALRGSRDVVANALHLDSDGKLNDSVRNPVQASGLAQAILDQQALDNLKPEDAAGRVLLVNHDVVDQVYQSRDTAVRNSSRLFELNPAGIVIVTRNSNQPGVSHGTFLGDNSVLAAVDPSLPRVPLLFFRIEDLSSAGISDYDGLSKIESAQLTWDVDVYSPGQSGNLIARIPGKDSSKAVILGAHIDSANSPGALDDGSGSVTLLEVARVLNEAQLQPPFDLYLAWFGSEELGLYGSGAFAATHQELLDRTIGMLQIDDLSLPIEGIDAYLGLNAWSYGNLGGPGESIPWADFLAQQVSAHGVSARAENNTTKYSDNNNLDGFNVPNSQLGYFNEAQMAKYGGPWPAGHIHDPYDNLDAVRPVVAQLVDMVKIALTAALEPPDDLSALRVPPAASQRALIVASHTESNHMTPAEANEFGMTLALAGFDVDLVPYGQPVTPADLQETQLVIVEPVYDFPSPDGDVQLYDTGWTQPELDALQAYVEQGGLLVITNSYHRVKHYTQLWEENEDRLDQNELSQRFGITFSDEAPFSGATGEAVRDHPLMQNAAQLDMARDNAVAFSAQAGTTLAQASSGQPLISLLPFGSQGGEVLILGDMTLLANRTGPSKNLDFWQNLAAYAAGR